MQVNFCILSVKLPRKRRRILPFPLNAGRLLTRMAFAGPEILSVCDVVFSSFAPAGKSVWKWISLSPGIFCGISVGGIS